MADSTARGSPRSRDDFEAAYLALQRNGELERRVAAAWARLGDCDLCARDCHVDRLRDVAGTVCRTGARALVASAGPHFGEEACLVGRGGSGTIFFSWCNLRCQFCQNHDISLAGHGREVETEQLAGMMLTLQKEGCLNINLVTPSHVVPQILAAVSRAADDGLRLPLVYNTGGYDALVSLALLDGVVDIYMPDMKYADEGAARKYSKARGYPEANRAAVKEMHRQVGELCVEADGVARRGLLVRHLVLPNGVAASEEILRFLADEISPNTFVNVMDQYHPCYRAAEHEEINRRVTTQEFSTVVRRAAELGLKRAARH